MLPAGAAHGDGQVGLALFLVQGQQIRQHIDKENSILFRMADQIIKEKDQDALFEQFEHHEESVIGHGVHEKLHSMIDVWAEAFGVE